MSIKDSWLLSSLIYFSFHLFDAFLGTPNMGLELHLVYIIIGIPFGYLIIESLNFIALCFFSYIKNGTRLLTMNMLLNLGRVFTAFMPFWFWENMVVYAKNKNESIELIFLIQAFLLLINIQWFIFSYKLRKENNRIKMNNMLTDPEYLRIVHELKTAPNLGIVNEKWNEGVYTFPRLAQTFGKLYRERQAELNQSNQELMEFCTDSIEVSKF